jgi:hypothetical protein
VWAAGTVTAIAIAACLQWIHTQNNWQGRRGTFHHRVIVARQNTFD